ncbi:substrate import-associated zinc metallohydrolase lipoprotein [Fulvivirga sp. M361]|uniref:substrate import-associated zinc metallohydrolase lipoprotein n=1 Tax=Fulvivirga sp. M361 TaxID=2594266 RepID=UPI001628205C|nr:substrate import-associated zinc metallohydrolase lipoprotein [Fulvivirga sp. M361]
MIKSIEALLAVIAIAFSFSGCYPDEGLDTPVKDDEIVLKTELDRYIQTNFTDRYGMAIRYKFEDRFVSPGEQAVPPRLDVVRPMLDFIDEFWIDPYLEVENGQVFFENHVPAEIVFLGGFIFNDDGTVTLGTADAGAQITFTNVNAIDPDSAEWRDLQLQTVYHEFAHTVHQRYKLPPSFETFSPGGYTSAGSWFNLTDEEALQRGFVSPYATSSPNEDFAETVAFFLFDPEFAEKFTENEEDCTTAECEARNEGRERIRQKIASISDHYIRVTEVDLEALRAAVQAKL